MQKATVGTRQIIDGLRTGLRDQTARAATLRRRAVAAARRAPQRLGGISAASSTRDVRPELRSGSQARGGCAHRAPLLRLLRRPAIRPLLGQALASERVLPIGVVLLILFSAIYSFSPLASGTLAVGGTEAEGSAPRIAIGGEAGVRAGVLSESEITDDPVTASDVSSSTGTDTEFSPESGAFLDDGTLLKPVAVDTSVADGRGLIVSYTVKQGDTLTGIAGQFGVTLQTIWWANSLSTTYQLKIGQSLLVPTVNGVVVHVAEGDTIEGLSAKYGIDPARIIEVNGLQDPNLVIGQTLVMPDAKGEAIPLSAQAPTPAPTPTRAPASRSTTTTARVSGPVSYSGGAFAWPVVGGGNYVSQSFHYGHYGTDIAADYGTKVVAAAAGTVIFSGWKSNGGGYQVWISHGSNLYTTYNHMSGLTVGSGQTVGRGQQVGRVGMSGNATGPHLHFEVWIGPIWNGGYRVNALNYY